MIPWDTIIIGMIGFVLSALAFISAQRALQAGKEAQTKHELMEEHKVDADAYARARSIYDAAIDQLRRQNDDLEQQLVRLNNRAGELASTIADHDARNTRKESTSEEADT
jgi:prefoldin subunit 5